MNNKRNTTILSTLGIIALLCVFACKSKPQDQKINPIITQLNNTKGNGILFGHQDDLAYGVGWQYIPSESDVKRVAGDYPALFGWELGGLDLGHDVNLDSVPFPTMRKLAVWAHEQGGINTFSWHPYSPIDSVDSWHGDAIVVKHILPNGAYNAAFNRQLDYVADFLLKLKDTEGNPIPFIFRPWHEMDGTWFWWGSKACSTADFKALFRYTIDYLHNKGVNNMVVAYSPDCNFSSIEEYLQWYPGDDMVDILGMDNYSDMKQAEGEKEAVKKLHLIINYANEKGKLSAFTETGLELVPDSTWYSQKLGYVLNDSIVKANISYIMVWRNASTSHFYFPFPGCPAASDAQKLLKQNDILLLKQFNNQKI